MSFVEANTRITKVPDLSKARDHMFFHSDCEWVASTFSIRCEFSLGARPEDLQGLVVCPQFLLLLHRIVGVSQTWFRNSVAGRRLWTIIRFCVENLWMTCGWNRRDMADQHVVDRRVAPSAEALYPGWGLP